MKRILVRFPEGNYPEFSQLLGFLIHDEDLSSWLAWSYEDDPFLSLLALPDVKMQPGKGVSAEWNLPVLTTPVQLAEWLGITSGELSWFANTISESGSTYPQKLTHYRYHWQPKRKGLPRLIESPKDRLKILQRQLLEQILNRIPVHSAAHGFCAGRSIVTAAERHVRQDMVLKMDLENFFPGILPGRIGNLFRWFGYPPRVVPLLVGICTNAVPADQLQQMTKTFPFEQVLQLRNLYQNRHLPQGAVCSPAVSNLVANRLDRRLDGFAKTQELQYTRYADDLVFSGADRRNSMLSNIRIMINAIVLDEGFRVRHRKTKVVRRGNRQQVLGIVVNQKLNVARCRYDQLHAILHNCRKFGPVSQNREAHPNFGAHLQGQISFVAMVNSKKAAKLEKIFKEIDWSGY
ncbi:reverse transcriptase family protein [uncultured Rubinisphaera sp.]|uniref:reverse transcriptase family protein n=1 Tax=uncultured Rubinisphaera sp. TaxID=1678686 RepID=UPI0030D861BE